MRVTINDIAKAANVSPSTVSRAIANNPRISKPTREKIYRIMKEMNYHPNVIARSLANKSTNIIGMVVTGATEKAFQHPFSRDTRHLRWRTKQVQNIDFQHQQP